jgi:hypothetical protein
MRAIFGDEAVESGPHNFARAQRRADRQAENCLTLPYFLVVFTVLDEEKEKPPSLRSGKYSLAARALGL